MNILIDVGHPAHVHNYRNLAKALISKGHKVYWSAKDIPIVKQLLDKYEFEYIVLPKKSDSILGKIFKQIIFDFILLWYYKKKKIDLALGTSVTLAHVSKISQLKSVLFDDDDDNVQPMVTKFVNPYATVLISPAALKESRARLDTVFYPGFHELAYLHPNYFNPDENVLNELGLSKEDTFYIMRFNTFNAHHDIGISGLTLEQKIELAKLLSQYGKVFITTERDIEEELEQYQLKISPEKIHSLMYYSSMFLGDSQTMSSEAVMLGVPTIRCNSFAGKLSTLKLQENHYKLAYSFLPQDYDQMLLQVDNLLSEDNLKRTWAERRKALLNDVIDVTKFWTWVIENHSLDINNKIKETGFWDQFK
jgi:predicted glycosyltransferase